MEVELLNPNLQMLSDLRERYINRLTELNERKNNTEGVMKTVHELQIDMYQNFIHDITEIINTMRNNATHYSNCVDIINNKLK
tara:strand:+ start:2332 stop:2580 length:249 start_codon:yes stop_codon:yes gene_type:complete